eukprot:m.179949 g.179949  ORF g.179949 m.179949 type:complete len:70 (+) comp31996_c0_seq1:1353-1562(+)
MTGNYVYGKAKRRIFTVEHHSHLQSCSAAILEYVLLQQTPTVRTLSRVILPVPSLVSQPVVSCEEYQLS